MTNGRATMRVFHNQANCHSLKELGPVWVIRLIQSCNSFPAARTKAEINNQDIMEHLANEMHRPSTDHSVMQSLMHISPARGGQWVLVYTLTLYSTSNDTTEGFSKGTNYNVQSLVQWNHHRGIHPDWSRISWWFWTFAIQTSYDQQVISCNKS